MRDLTILVRRGAPITKNVLWKGLRIRVYSIGWLCLLTSMSRQTIRLWESNRTIPQPLLKVPGTYRWYTPKEVELYSAAIHKHYSGSRDLHILKQTLHVAVQAAQTYYAELARLPQVAAPQKLANEEDLIKAMRTASMHALSLEPHMENHTNQICKQTKKNPLSLNIAK